MVYDPAKQKVYTQRYLAKHPDAYRRKALRRFGLTLEKYQEMVEDQGGVCLLRGKPNWWKPSLAVDHDHVTGRVRGLLCSSCNRGLGFFFDNPKLLRAAADYLEVGG